MMRIRTIDQCYDEILAMDPDTAITRRAVRRAVTEGHIPSRRVGNGKQKKWLVDLGEVLKYFAGAGEGEG